MKKIVIPMHSIIALITNSSTEIFTSASDNGVKYVKELIENILKAAGSEKTVDELFEVKFSRTLSGYTECPICTEDNEAVEGECIVCKGEGDVEELELDELPEEIQKEILERYDEDQKISSDIVIIAKTSEGENLGKHLRSLFYSEEKYY